MDWMNIEDGFGSPISAKGIYESFTETKTANSKSHFMRINRILVCNPAQLGASEKAFVCDDVSEFEAISSVIDTCARLAAIGGKKGDGNRIAVEDDLFQIDGFELFDNGAFLHIDLSSSYWYRRFLYSTIKTCFDTFGDRSFPPIHNYGLSDPQSNSPSLSPSTFSSLEESSAFEHYNRGTFRWPAAIDDPAVFDLVPPENRRIYYPSMLSDITKRRAFMSFSPVPDYKYAFDERQSDNLSAIEEHALSQPGYPQIESEMCDAAFWGDCELIIKARGETLRHTAQLLADSLISMHTSATIHSFDSTNGFKLIAPTGLAALWADFAQDITHARICICLNCGRPTIQYSPRGKPQKFCSNNNKCRMQYKRKNEKQ